jgi:hypothetical protein
LNEAQETIGEDEHRHRCLVRWVIKKRLQDRDSAYKWLNGYRDSLGQYKKGWNELHPKSSLESDVRDQWQKGNRGNEGEWK